MTNTEKSIKIVIIFIGILLAIMFCIIVGIFTTTIESKTFNVTCYDSNNNEIQGVICEKIVYCNFLDSMTENGCEKVYNNYENIHIRKNQKV